MSYKISFIYIHELSDDDWFVNEFPFEEEFSDYLKLDNLDFTYEMDDYINGKLIFEGIFELKNNNSIITDKPFKWDYEWCYVSKYDKFGFMLKLNSFKHIEIRRNK